MMGTEAAAWLDDMADTRPCLTAESNDSCMVLATVQRELSYDSTRTNFPASTTPVPYQLEAIFTARVTIDDICVKLHFSTVVGLNYRCRG